MRGPPEREVPGGNPWTTQICRRAGFRLEFIAEAQSVGEAFSMIASENAVALVPDYFTTGLPPGIITRPLNDPAARWDLLLT